MKNVFDFFKFSSRFNLRSFVIWFCALIAVCSIGLSFWLWQLNSRVEKALQQKDVFITTQVVDGGFQISTGMTDFKQILATLQQRYGLRLRSKELPLLNLDYTQYPCDPDLSTCFDLRIDNADYFVRMNPTNRIEELRFHSQPVSNFQLPPRPAVAITQTEMVARSYVSLESIPSACRYSVLAIEDNDFLDHRGVSLTGLLRAAWVTLSGGHKQGGSTITMQLVKNMILSPERTLTRKLTELGMAPLLEIKATKDQILELYLNVIYMGQDGPFQVRGFQAAANYYFGKDLETLTGPQCATLAAILNSPGLYNPFKNKEKVQKRRDLVIQKLFDHQHILAEEMSEWKAQPLNVVRNSNNSVEDLAFYIDAAKSANGGFPAELRTGMDLKAQSVLQKTVQRWQSKLSTPELKVEIAAVLVDVPSGAVQALVGGSDFRRAPYNRAIKAKRQIGSLMKPIVYLAALSSDQKNYTPDSLVEDTSFEVKYEGQKWTPKNYDAQYFGSVPLYFALMKSLNSATARIGADIGLDAVVQTLRDLGVQQPIDNIPALTLGALELTPVEVAQVYLKIARFGLDAKLWILAEDQDFSTTQLVSPQKTAELISMMQQTTEQGTARSLRRGWNFVGDIAGKTGTTSDNRDAWFVGFTPQKLMVVWTGNDQNKATQLTGASSSLQVFADYFNQMRFAHDDQLKFEFPEETELRTVQHPDLEQFDIPLIFSTSEL